MLVAPLAGRAMIRVGSERLATAGFLVAAAGALWTGLSAPGQEYAEMLPGIVGLGEGLAMSTAAITATAIHDVPAARLGVASALPNISRYTGGAPGAAVLGAILNANVPAGLERALGRVGGRARAGGRRASDRRCSRRRRSSCSRRSPPPACRGSTRASRRPPLRRHRSTRLSRGEGRRLPRAGARDAAHIALAEELGFASAWCYDSPLLYQDPFVALARAAERTRRIDLGVGVLVPGCARPSRRSALRALTALAPGRVRAAVGAGFTGRFTLGLRPVRLAQLERESTTSAPCWRARSARTSRAGGRCATCRCRARRAPGRCRSTSSCRGERAQALARRRETGR